jgi:hypothetical protein
MKYLLPLFLIVITEPYKGIIYDRINAYTITNHYRKIDIEVSEREETYYEDLSYYSDEPSTEVEYSNLDVLPSDQYYNTGQDHEFYYFQKLFNFK